MKRLFIILFLLIGIAASDCNAQDSDASWLHNELWSMDTGSPTLGRINASKFYFAGSGEFYYGGEYSHNSKAFSGSLVRSYSGMYDYNPSTREISLHTTMLNGRDTLFIRTFWVEFPLTSDIIISLREKESQWNMYRKKGECTFVMPASPVLFSIKTMNIDSLYSEWPFDLRDESNVDISDQKKILDILRHTQQSKTTPSLDEWKAKANIIITMADGGEESARIFIRKGESTICVEAEGWISGFILQYEMSETSLEEIIEISKKYIHNQN
ncbi:MAG: hypothetical protein ACK5KL_19210 [Dysgonomonas sp.]